MRWSLTHMLLLALFLPATASAKDFHPSKSRMIVHGWKKLGDNCEDVPCNQLRSHVLPSPNLGAAQLKPIGYVGYAIMDTHFMLEPAVGYFFATDQPILSPRAFIPLGNVWGFAILDWQPFSGEGYYFSQIEWKPQGQGPLMFGIESEGSGKWKDYDTWSYGGGPNILIETSHVTRIDIAGYIWCPSDEQCLPQVFVRFQLFFKE